MTVPAMPPLTSSSVSTSPSFAAILATQRRGDIAGVLRLLSPFSCSRCGSGASAVAGLLPSGLRPRRRGKGGGRTPYKADDGVNFQIGVK